MLCIVIIFMVVNILHFAPMSSHYSVHISHTPQLSFWWTKDPPVNFNYQAVKILYLELRIRMQQNFKKHSQKAFESGIKKASRKRFEPPQR